MQAPEHRPLRPEQAAARLRATLERLATALVSLDVDAVLACEADFPSLLADVAGCDSRSPESSAATTRELRRAQAALTRCRRLGASLDDLTTLTLSAQGAAPAYGRRGETRAAVAAHRLEAKG
jgi:hypothetical protein